jgi:hypothetical protein
MLPVGLSCCLWLQIAMQENTSCVYLAHFDLSNCSYYWSWNWFLIIFWNAWSLVQFCAMSLCMCNIVVLVISACAVHSDHFAFHWSSLCFLLHALMVVLNIGAILRKQTLLACRCMSSGMSCGSSPKHPSKFYFAKSTLELTIKFFSSCARILRSRWQQG